MSEILVIIRPSFMKFCKDGCRSALFNHILYWIAKKSKDQSQEAIQSGEVTWYAKNEALTQQMADAWSDKKIRLEVNALIEMGLVGRGRNPKFGADRTKHFYFGQEQYNKLIELCKKHQICLAHIGLQKEVINLLAAFDKSIECPCTGQMVNLPYQMENIPNANGKFTECSEHEQMVNLPSGNGKFTGAITKISTKKTKTKISNERKNDEGQQTSTVTDQQGSFSHPSNILSISLSPEVKQTYDLICQELYPNCPPSLTTKAIEHFTKLSKGIKTVEDIKGLVAYCRQEQPILKTSKIHPGNLVRWLDGWLQSSPPVTKQSPEQEEPIVADEELAEDLRRIVRAYHDEDRFEMWLESVKTMKRQMRTNNYDMCDRMANTYRKCLSTGSGIDGFLESLRLSFY